MNKSHLIAYVAEELHTSKLQAAHLVDTVLGGSYRYRAEAPRFPEDFGADYSDFDRFNEVSQVGVSARFDVGRHWALTYRVAYSVIESSILTNGGANRPT